MRKSIIALSLLGAVLGLASVSAEAAPRGPAKFYDQHGGFRGYSWCLKSGTEIYDCNYFNKAQCDVSASARRLYCVPNPFGVEQGVLSYGGPIDAPVSSKKVRRQVY
jgi:hypothetical protein